MAKRRTKKTAREQRLEAALDGIKQATGIETFETRRSDVLDFHDVAVWQIREAIKTAFDAGDPGHAGVRGTVRHALDHRAVRRGIDNQPGEHPWQRRQPRRRQRRSVLQYRRR